MKIQDIIPSIREIIPYTYDSNDMNSVVFEPIINSILKSEPSVKNPNIVHMLGIPGAGKSTFYRKNQELFKNYILIDFDMVMEKVPQYHEDRKKLGNLEAFKKWELPARVAGYELLKRAIQEKKNIFFDHGGTPLCHRELLKNIKKIGYETTMYYIDCAPQTAIQRISNRERPFPAERMPERVRLINEQKKVMPQIVDHFIEINNG